MAQINVTVPAVISNFFAGSWKTTSAGLVVAYLQIQPELDKWCAGQPVGKRAILVAFLTALALYFAGDADKSVKTSVVTPSGANK